MVEGDNKNSFYDLTTSQSLIWTGQKISPNAPLYNMALAFELNGIIDELLFKKAFHKLVQSCDVMRSVFEETENSPQQKFIENFNFELLICDFTNESQSVDQWLKQRSQVQFNLGEQLFDSALLKLTPSKYIWYFNQHHLITDAWAMTEQYKFVAKCYEQLIKKESIEEISLPPFSSYINFEKVQSTKPQFRKAKEYWETKVKNNIGPLKFFNQSNPELNSKSIRYSITIPKVKADALRQMTQAADLKVWTEHLSLFSMFSTLLVVYLRRLTGQNNISFCTPSHNRDKAVFKETPGIFIELFPILVSVKKEDSFTDLYQKVKNEALEFLRYAQTGVSSPKLYRGFNVVLNYINASFSDFGKIPMQSQWIHPDHVDPGHHLRLQVHDFDGDGSIKLCFDLNESIFSPQQAELVPTQFLKLVDAFIQDRTQNIFRPSLTTKVPHFLTGSQQEFSFKEKTVIQLFENIVDSSEPLTPAIQYGEKLLSYQDLDKHANQLAHFLIQNGLEKGKRVVLFLPRSPEYVISVLAVLKAGGVFIPIPTNYPSGRVLGIIQDAQAKLILSNSVLTNNFPTLEGLICLDKEEVFINQKENIQPNVGVDSNDSAYIIYTSGSTGVPKGVEIGHRSLSHYMQWANFKYSKDFKPVCPLFTAIGFDLTITSLFLPILNGGTLITYQEPANGPDLSFLNVIKENRVNFIKVTPSHLSLLQGSECKDSILKCMVVGGENFKVDLAKQVTQNLSQKIKIYNEYGPTEATVGCVLHEYDAQVDDNKTAVPIGLPIANTSVYILDENLNQVPDGVTGELYIAGTGVAKGYWNQKELTESKFINSPFNEHEKLYHSGDLVRVNVAENILEYLGRKDEQIKIQGRRVELTEIESLLNQHPNVKQGIVQLRTRRRSKKEASTHNCLSCGLPSNYPSSTFNEEGICHLCQNFKSYQEKVKDYFRTKSDLKKLFSSLPEDVSRNYDCIMLLSGGKDSTYALSQLKDMGLNVLAFTLDNGYISEEAIANVKRVVGALGIDHVFGKTEAMNAIFVDSLQRHCNVCDGCFKTIYTLSVKTALEKNIPFIVTGLSRGQFFETRLTEELFKQKDFNPDDIDEVILNARKAYHQVDDAVKELLDVSVFEDDTVFEKVRFIDFYRYSDVSLEDMMEYLDEKLPWERPTDTGRSTNCLINQAGIYVHKKELGYSNYAFPYSWDVRIGHKTRDASLEEINEEINENEVLKILDEIGYTHEEEISNRNEKLVAYYTGITSSNIELKNFLLARLPAYMVPVQFIKLDEWPLTVNGKIDQSALPLPDRIRPDTETVYASAQTEFEEIIQAVWSDVLEIDQIGIHDNFLMLGGDSLTGIRVMTRLSDEFELKLPVNLIFNKLTIAQLAIHIEARITKLLQEMESDSIS